MPLCCSCGNEAGSLIYACARVCVLGFVPILLVGLRTLNLKGGLFPQGAPLLGYQMLLVVLEGIVLDRIVFFVLLTVGLRLRPLVHSVKILAC